MKEKLGGGIFKKMEMRLRVVVVLVVSALLLATLSTGKRIFLYCLPDPKLRDLFSPPRQMPDVD